MEARNITTLITRYAKFAPELTGNGYDTTPLDGKKPILHRWQHRPNTALEFNKYNGKNTGILCGGLSHLFAVDVDVYTKEVAEIIKGFAIEMLGEAPERIGQAPKTMLIYRLSEPTRKLRSIIVNIDEKDCAVEILAEGQQFVASGVHDTGVNYSWPGDNLLAVPINELTEVNPNQLQDFLALVNQTLLKYGEQKQSINHDGTPKTPDFLATTELEGKKEEIDIALAHIPNDDLHYEDWVYQAHALKGALQDDGFDLFDKWSKRSDKYDAQETERVWGSIGLVNNVGAGTIFHQAKEYGFEVSEHRNQTKEMIVKEEAIEAVSTGRGLVFDDWDSIAPSGGADDFVEGVFGEKQMGVLYGESNSGKTFFILWLCSHVAFGWDWNEREVDQGGVVYCALEGAHGIRNRIAAIKEHFKDDIAGEIPDFAVCTTALDLLSAEGDTSILIESIKEKTKHFTRPLRIIIIDTLARAMGGGNENSSEDMGLLIRHADEIRAATGAFVLFVHHSGKDQSKGARGHSALRAATDTEIEVTCDKNAGISTATVKKQREFEGGEIFNFKLEYVELGINRRNKPYGSCVVLPASEEEAAQVKAKASGLTDNQAKVVLYLRRLIEDKGIKLDGHSRKSVNREQLIASMAGVFRDNLSANNQTVRRVLNNKSITQTITERDGRLWLVSADADAGDHI